MLDLAISDRIFKFGEMKDLVQDSLLDLLIQLAEILFGRISKIRFVISEQNSLLIIRPVSSLIILIPAENF